MSKKKDKVKITIPSPASEDVTGSMIYIQSSNHKILLDCGLHQNPNTLEQYRANMRNLPFKPKDIDYVFILHFHADHMLLLPRLVREGFCGRVITTKGARTLFPIMGKDSAHISRREKELLEKKYKKQFELIYEEQDVYDSLDYFDEYDFREKIKLDDNLEFEFYSAGHILGSAQVKLWIREGSHVKTIGYTSDIGSNKVKQFYTEKFDPMDKVQVLFGEATYSRQTRDIKKKDRENDLNKLHDIIRNVCCDNKKKVLIPSFSLSRSQNILTHLYSIFGEDENFHIPILIDSPLTISICEAYEKMLEGEDLELFKKVMNWKNVKLVREYKESQAWQNGKDPCICIASSGMITAGRSVSWTKALLPDRRNHILFIGFAVEGSIANRIKNGHKQKTINIEKKSIANRCGITELRSFSSHADRGNLLEYYSNIQADKICLLHSDFKSKTEFAKDLQKEISKKCKTGKVVVVNRSTVIMV